MELLCKNCLYGENCYELYAGDDCWNFSPYDFEISSDSVITPVVFSSFQSCSTLQEHNQMVAVQEAWEDMKNSDSELEEYPF